MKNFFVAIFCVIASFTSNAQTTLSPGDVMFVGINSDNVGSTSPYFEEVALLFLEPVTTGTEIYLTDMGYIGNSSPFFLQNENNGCTSGAGAAADGLMKWTATSNVSAGTQLLIRANTTSGALTASTGTITGIVARNSSSSIYINLPGGGDELFIFQGTLNGSDQVTSATVLSALNYESAWASVTNCTTISGSANPNTGYDIFFSSHDDNGYYSGATTGSKATLQAAISNFSNWTTNSSSTVTLPISGSFTVGATTTTWNGTSWSNGTPDSTLSAIIDDTATVNSFKCDDLTINSGSALNLGNSSIVTLYGDLTNNGNGVTGTGTITFAKSGTATISGDTLELEGVLTVSSGCTLSTGNKLRLLSGATNTGRIGESGGTIIGNVYVQRYMPGKRAFRFYGHPFSSSIALNQLTDEIDITGNGGSSNGFTTTQTNNSSAYWFDVTTADTSTTGANPGWTAFVSANTASWDQYELLRLMVRGAKGEGLNGGTYTPSAAIFEATGPVNQGTQVITLAKGSNTEFAGVGNPFPSPVQMNTVARGSNVGANYYAWDATSGASGAYITNQWSTSYVLPAYAAFFTTVTANTNNTLTFEEQDKDAGGASLFKGTANDNFVELIVSDSNTRWDRLLINLDNNGIAAEDRLDGKKLYNPGLDFFTLSEDNVRLAVDVRPYSDQKSIPLGLTAYTRYNKYVIKTGMFSIPAGTKLILHDKYLNTKQELKAGFEYWFDVTADKLSQGNERFEINMIGKPSGIIEEGQHVQMFIVPNPAHNEVKVSFGYLESSGQVQLVSITGRVIYTSEVHAGSGSIIVPLQPLPGGMYIVKLNCKNAVSTQKLIKN